MKRKLTSEDLRLWHSQVKDVIPLSKTEQASEEPKLSKPPRPRGRPVEKHLEKRARPLSPPQAFTRKEFRRVKIEARFDLHGLTLEEGLQALERFLQHAQEKGFKTVLIITGKGSLTSERTLRQQFPRWLQETPLRHFVASFQHPAKQHDGGQGAFYVKVRQGYVKPFKDK